MHVCISARHLINVAIYFAVQDERDQQRLHVLLRDVEALGNEGNAYPCVGLDKLEQHLQQQHWLQWGVTFSQVVWLIGC